MKFKTLLKYLRNDDTKYHFSLYEGDGWGKDIWHVPLTNASEAAVYWDKHQDDPGFDATYYRMVMFIQHPNKKFSYCLNTTELNELIERGF